MEHALFVVALVAGVAALTLRVRHVRGRAWGAATAATVLALVLAASWRPAVDELAAVTPDRPPEGGFVSSDRCRACHPKHYATWHGSYHRTMTQVATPGSVLADFDTVLTDRERSYALERRGDGFWVDLVDPLWEMQNARQPSEREPESLPRIRQRVVMTTGSHHLQAYWLQRPDSNGVYYQLPMLWFVGEQRWIPAQDSFLLPPVDHLSGFQQWNVMCSLCHAVAAQPRQLLDEETGRGTMFSRTPELGIACESCHGPGEEHVRANQWPQRRYLKHLSDAADPTIVDPRRLDHRRSTEVCGQCHAFFTERDKRQWLVDGPPYRPGDELDRTKLVFRYTETPEDPLLLKQLQTEPDALSGRFWADGTIRVAGREFNGLLESPCHTRGEMTCLSCHSMHDYAEPNDMLSAAVQDDESCLQCHGDYRARVAEHTHHAAGSSGSRCMNCHMPHTTYGLFTAMRSHRIDSPSAAVSARTGRPNACNLCHVDRPLSWTAEYLGAWYGHDPVELDEDQREVAAAVLQALKGDAAQRAIAAWSLGWEAARGASGQGWQAPFLAQLLIDPYAAVRQVALRSLRQLPGFEEFEYDFVGPPAARRATAQRALEEWQRQPPALLDRSGAAVLIEGPGKVLQKTLLRLLDARDDRPVRIVE